MIPFEYEYFVMSMYVCMYSITTLLLLLLLLLLLYDEYLLLLPAYLLHLPKSKMTALQVTLRYAS